MNGLIPVVAGAVSTIIFAASALPMLWKALRTRDLHSYSLGHICLSNIGNAVHSIYVFHLPPGPIWVLHSFYAVAAAVMLVWYLRFSLVARRPVAHRRRQRHQSRRPAASAGRPVTAPGASPPPAPVGAPSCESSTNFSGGACRVEAGAFVAVVRGGPDGRPSETGDDSNGAEPGFRSERDRGSTHVRGTPDRRPRCVAGAGS
jgi:hypothetical protein